MLVKVSFDKQINKNIVAENDAFTHYQTIIKSYVNLDIMMRQQISGLNFDLLLNNNSDIKW